MQKIHFMVQIWNLPIVLSVTKVSSRSYVGNHGNDRRTCAPSVATILDLRSSRPFFSLQLVILVQITLSFRITRATLLEDALCSSALSFVLF